MHVKDNNQNILLHILLIPAQKSFHNYYIHLYPNKASYLPTGIFVYHISLLQIPLLFFAIETSHMPDEYQNSKNRLSYIL